MLKGRIAPTTIVIRQGIVWRAKVGGGDSDSPREAPFWVIIAPHFITRAATQSIVEQGCA